MVARHERPADRLDQLAGEEAALAEAGRRGEQDGELGAGHARDQARRPSRVDLPLDPPRRRLQHGVAGRRGRKRR